MSWVLILALWEPGGGAAINSVPGFTNQSECLAAGNAWLRQLGERGYVWPRASALCVQRGGK